MIPQHRQEALRALDQVIVRLTGPEPLDGLARFQLKASVEFARGEVEQIAELKRMRRSEPSSSTEAP
jgi:hypothetical protein